MRAIVLVAAVLSLLLYTALPASAIIFIPALVLIPIAKIIAVVIGGLSFPALGVSTLWSKSKHSSFKKAVFYCGIFLAILALTLAILLKFANPDRPLF